MSRTKLNLFGLQLTLLLASCGSPSDQGNLPSTTVAQTNKGMLSGAAPRAAIPWVPCPNNQAFRCATVQLPGADSETVEVNISSWTAPGTPPNAPVIYVLSGDARTAQIQDFQNRIGLLPKPSGYTLMALDPVGTNFMNSEMPTCFDNHEAEMAYLQDLKILPPLDYPLGYNGGTAYLNNHLAYAQICADKNKVGFGQVNNFTLARQLRALNDLVTSPQAPLHLMTTGDGSIPAQIALALYPKSMGKVVTVDTVDLSNYLGSANTRDIPYLIRTEAPKASSRALDEFLRTCQESSNCALHQSGTPKEVVRRVFDKLAKGPVTVTGSTGSITYSHQQVTDLTLRMLESPQAFRGLAVTLQQLDSGIAPITPESERSYNEKARGGHRAYALDFMNCTEVWSPQHEVTLPYLASLNQKVHPHFGAYYTYNHGSCMIAKKIQPANVDRSIVLPDPANTTASVLAVGTAYSPYYLTEYSQSLANKLNGVYVNYKGWGKSAFNTQNSCVVQEIIQFFESTTPVASKEVSCQPDIKNPFD